MSWWQSVFRHWSRDADTARLREQAARERRATENLTPYVERAAEHLMRLPDAEFADRVRRALSWGERS